MAEVYLLEYPDPLVWWQFALALAGIGLGAFAIGAVGLGGVVWVPLLMLLGLPARVAIGSTFVACTPMSMMNVALWHRKGLVPWRQASPVAVGALPASFFGAYVVEHVPGELLAFLIAAICFYSGGQELRKRWRARRRGGAAAAPPGRAPRPHYAEPGEPGASPSPTEATRICAEPSPAPAANPPAVELLAAELPAAESPAAEPAAIGLAVAHTPQRGRAPVAGADAGPPPPAAEALEFFPGWRGRAVLVALGLVIGFVSSITGTGGPILFFPMMFALRPDVPMHTVIGYAKPFASALVLAASVGALVFGEVDFGLVLIMAPLLVAGVTLGATLAFRLPAPTLKLAAAAGLVATAAAVTAQTAARLAGGGGGSAPDPPEA